MIGAAADGKRRIDEVASTVVAAAVEYLRERKRHLAVSAAVSADSGNCFVQLLFEVVLDVCSEAE